MSAIREVRGVDAAGGVTLLQARQSNSDWLQERFSGLTDAEIGY